MVGEQSQQLVLGTGEIGEAVDTTSSMFCRRRHLLSAKSLYGGEVAAFGVAQCVRVELPFIFGVE